MKDNTLRESNAKVNRMVNELETITYYKHHYVRKTGLKKVIKALLAEEVRKARIDELNHVQLEYGHHLAQTFAGGEAQKITDRINQLEKESK